MSNLTASFDAGINHGDQAWQLTAGTFVALQSIPGLAIMYAGLSKAKWAINSAFMALYAFAATMVVWVLFAYNMGFGKKWIPLCGVPMPVLDIDRELRLATIPATGATPTFNLATLVFFQFAFASAPLQSLADISAITIIIIAGSLLGRMNFMAWALFVPLWITFSYSVVAFSIWSGGFLTQLGVKDFAGGYVIHVSSGTAGFIAAAIVGPRHQSDRAEHRPSNLGFCVIGAGIVWCGWSGFNGGAPLSAGADAGVAVLNTYVCTATALLFWTLLDALYYKKPAILGSIQGMICGLVAITPAAGFIDGWAAIVLGIITAGVPWATMNLCGRMRPLCYVDDTLGVVHTHLVAGAVGAFLTACFATEKGSNAFGDVDGGAIAGNARQIWVELVACLFVIGWNVVWTPLILFFISIVCRVPLRAPDEVLIIGDDAIHGEEAYSLSMPMLERRDVIARTDPYRRMSHDGAHDSAAPTVREPHGHIIPMSELREMSLGNQYRA